jgi:hypothetical protein
MQLQLHFNELNTSKAFGTKQQASQMVSFASFLCHLYPKKRSRGTQNIPFLS